MTQIESFTLDHNAVHAPYVRLAGSETHDGAKLSKFDLRLIQPNETAMSTAAIHTLEHLLATQMRQLLEGIIDLSPMGCRTGFYLIVWDKPSCVDVAIALLRTLQAVLAASEVPATTAEACGNFRDHSLAEAQAVARRVIEQGISSDAFERQVVSVA